jgi:hypothetical protein
MSNHEVNAATAHDVDAGVVVVPSALSGSLFDIGYSRAKRC